MTNFTKQVGWNPGLDIQPGSTVVPIVDASGSLIGLTVDGVDSMLTPNITQANCNGDTASLVTDPCVQKVLNDILSAEDSQGIIDAINASGDVLERVETTDCSGDPALNVTQACEWRDAFFQNGCAIVSGRIKYATADGSVLSSVVTHDPSGEYPAGSDASPLLEISPEQYPNGLPCASDDFDNTLKVGQTATIDASANDTICADYADRTYNVINSANVTILSNGDGTFDVTPEVGSCGGVWSFDYEVSCAEGYATATVSGEIIDEPVSFDLNVENATGVLTINRIDLSDGGTYDVTWPDGTVTTGHASGGSASHDLGAASYTGIVTVMHSSCGEVGILQLSNNSGWAVNDANISALERLYSLYLQNTSSVITDQALINVPSLRSISLGDTDSVITDAGLLALTELRTLSLYRTLSVITDAGIAPHTETLRILSVTNTTSNITDASLTGAVNLLSLNISNSNSLITDAALSTMVSLTALIVSNGNSSLTAAAFPAGLVTYYSSNTPIDQTQVDDILAWFVANGPASGRLDLRNTVTPSAAGIADQATLEAAGYRNTVNDLPIV